MTHLPDQTDYRYRALLAKYMRYHLTKDQRIILPTRSKEAYFTREEWDRLRVVADEVVAASKVPPAQLGMPAVRGNLGPRFPPQG